MHTRRRETSTSVHVSGACVLRAAPPADFLEVAVSTIRENGGSMLVSELVNALDESFDASHGGITREGTWMERELTGTG